MPIDPSTGKDYDATPTGLPQLTHAQLYSMRQGQPALAQALIAPYEHRAFAREAVTDNPLLSAPVLAGALLWDPAKAAGVMNGRSAPSLQSMAQGLLGWREGYAASNPPVQAPGLLGSIQPNNGQ